MYRISMIASSFLFAASSYAAGVTMHCSVKDHSLPSGKRPKRVEIHLSNKDMAVRLYTKGNRTQLLSRWVERINRLDITDTTITAADSAAGWSLALQRHSGREAKDLHWLGTIEQGQQFRATIKCTTSWDSYSSYEGHALGRAHSGR